MQTPTTRTGPSGPSVTAETTLLMAAMEEMGQLMGPVDYYDLKTPWLHSPTG